MMPIERIRPGDGSQHPKEILQSQVRLLLLWVAASDGELAESELEFIASRFPGVGGTITRDDFLTVIRKSDLKVIEKAVRTVAAESRDLRTAFLDMAISLSMADGRLAVAENHILRFYADALHLGLGVLQKRFQTIAGKPLPEPGDPGDPDWWDQAGQHETVAAVDRKRLSGNTMTVAQAETVLGVSLNATQADIERAYQNLASVFQVDRVKPMGTAAVSAADAQFRKIQQAYQLLKDKN